LNEVERCESFFVSQTRESYFNLLAEGPPVSIMPSNLQDLIGFWNSQSMSRNDDIVRKGENLNCYSVNKDDEKFSKKVSRSSLRFEKYRGGDETKAEGESNVNKLEKERLDKSCMPHIVINDQSCQKESNEDQQYLGKSKDYKSLEGFEDANSQSGRFKMKNVADVSPFEKFRTLENLNKRIKNTEPKLFQPAPLCLPKNPIGLPLNFSCPSPTGSPTLCPKSPVRSASAAKEIILTWVQKQLKEYPITVSNFSSCWSDGLAFCFLIHSFFPDSFEWTILSKENREYNLTLAFDKAEELAGICPLLDVEDILKFEKPDWKCIFTYVQSFYRRFRNVKSSNDEEKGDTSTKEK